MSRKTLRRRVARAPAAPALWADDIVAGFGVNTHLNWYDTNYFSLRESHLVPAMIDLGVRAYRDTVDVIGDSALRARMDELLADHGMKPLLITGNDTAANDKAKLDLWATTPGKLWGVEGANEPADDAASVVAKDRIVALSALLRADADYAGALILGPSYIRSSNVTAAGNISSSIDAVNIHPYPGSGRPETDGIDSTVGYADDVKPGGPFVSTETGYHTHLPETGFLGVTEAAAAIYMPRLILDTLTNADCSVRGVFLYEMMSQNAAWAGDREKSFGLLDTAGANRPQFHAVKALLDGLRDPGPRLATRALAVRLSGSNPNVQMRVFARRNGTFVLALWNAVSVFNQATKTDIAVADVTETLTFGETVTAASVGGSALTIAGGTVTLPVGPAVKLVSLTAAVSSVTAGAATAPVFGILASRDEGTTGDYYVDPVNGSDANAGTSVGAPKRTVTAARGNNRHIKMRAGAFREFIDLSGYTGITLSRFGTEPAVVSGLDMIPAGSWGALQATDLPYFTAAQAASGAIKRAVVATSSISGGSARAAFLHEGATPLVPAMLTGASPALPSHTHAEDQWVKSPVATSAGLNSFVLPAAHQGQGYTALQVQNADLHVHDGAANFNYRVAISGYNAGTHTVSQTAGNPGWGRSSIAQKQDLFALINFLPLLKQGEWGYRVDGSNTILYVWPTDAASLTGGTIGYAARAKGIKMGSGCTLRGLRTHGHATTAQAQNGAMGIDLQGTAGVTVENCLVESVWNLASTAEAGYGAIYGFTADDAVVSNCHVERAYGTKGYNFSPSYPGHGSSGTLMADGARGNRNKVKLCTCAHAEYSPILFHGQDQSVVLGFEVTAVSGTMAHSNKLEAYLQGSRCAFVGLNLDKSGGYATIQQSSNMAFLTCSLAAGTDYDGRGFDDQGTTSYPTPAQLGLGTTANYMLSCRLPPHPNGLSGTWFGTVRKGSSSASGTWTLRSCISHGVSLAGSGHTVEHSVITGNTVPSGTGNTSVTLASVYVDAGAGNYAYAPGAAFRSTPRRDLSAEVAVIKGWFDGTGPGGTGRLFTDAEFDIDATGAAVNWAAAPFGALNSYGP